MTLTTPTAPTTGTGASNPLATLTRELGNIVKQFHSEAALVMGVLSGLGVTPNANKWTTGILVGYAALTKAFAPASS